jgi:hypothetical protein
MERKIAIAISYLFHPLFAPLIGLFLVFNSTIYLNYILTEEAKKIIYILTFFNTFLLPFSVALFFYKKKIISSFMAEDRNARLLLYLSVFIFYMTTFALFQKFFIPELIVRFILGAAISIFILFLLTLKWRISAHLTGVGGLCAMVVVLNEFFGGGDMYFVPIILLSGVIGFSRLLLNAHRPVEVYVGFFIGFISVYFSVVW